MRRAYSSFSKQAKNFVSRSCTQTCFWVSFSPRPTVFENHSFYDIVKLKFKWDILGLFSNTVRANGKFSSYKVYPLSFLILLTFYDGDSKSNFWEGCVKAHKRQKQLTKNGAILHAYFSHGVWKSQKKSHSTLRAKRATFTFWMDES